MSLVPNRRFMRAAPLAIGLTLAATPVLAEHSASVYRDADADLGTLYGYVTTVDGSSHPDCGHSAYTTYGELSGPTGTDGGYEQGFLKYVAVPAGEGDFSLYGELSMNCSCWGGWSSNAASFINSVAYRHHYNLTAIGNPNTYSLDEDSLGRHCAHSSLTWDPTSLSGMTDQGLAWYILFAPMGCASVCTSGKINPVIGPGGAVRGPATCGP